MPNKAAKCRPTTRRPVRRAIDVGGQCADGAAVYQHHVEVRSSSGRLGAAAVAVFGMVSPSRSSGPSPSPGGRIWTNVAERGGGAQFGGAAGRGQRHVRRDPHPHRGDEVLGVDRFHLADVGAVEPTLAFAGRFSALENICSEPSRSGRLHRARAAAPRPSPVAQPLSGLPPRPSRRRS